MYIDEKKPFSTKRTLLTLASFFGIILILGLVYFAYTINQQNKAVDSKASERAAYLYDDADKYEKTMYITFGFDWRFDPNARDATVAVPGVRNETMADNSLKDMAKTFESLQGPYVRTGLWMGNSYNRCTNGAPNFEYSANPQNNPVCNGNGTLNYALDRAIQIQQTTSMPIYIQLGGYNWDDIGENNPQFDYNDALQITPAGPDSRGNTIPYPNNQWGWDGNAGQMVPYVNENQTGQSGLEQALTLNYYNVHRTYRRRNLQAAVQSVINKLTQSGQPILAGISLDSDLNMGGWGAYGYRDYNPDTIRQFREWLTCTGPYAAGQPYYSYRRSVYTSENADADAYIGRCFNTSQEINTAFGTNFSSIDRVDPPKLGANNAVGPAAQWGNQSLWIGQESWWKEWQRFRQHLVHVSVNDSVDWINQAGVPLERIFPHTGVDPYSPKNVMDYRIAKNPANGQISSTTDNFGGTYESTNSRGGWGSDMYFDNVEYKYNKPGDEGRPTFSVIKKTNPNWSNNEFYWGPTGEVNTTTPFPYEKSYQLIRDYFNYGQHTMLIQAWHTPGCGELWGSTVSTTDNNVAIRHCNGEEALLNFMSLYRAIPRGSFAWEFGTGTSLKPPAVHSAFGLPQNPPAFDRSTDDGWNAPNQIANFRAEDGKLKGTITGNDPFVHSSDWITVAGKANDKVKVKMKITPTNGTRNVIAQLMWTTEDQRDMGANGKEVGIGITADGQWREYTFEVGTRSNWNGKWIKQLRLDPSNDSALNGAALEIEYVRVCPYNEGACSSNYAEPTLTPTLAPTSAATKFITVDVRVQGVSQGVTWTRSRAINETPRGPAPNEFAIYPNQTVVNNQTSTQRIPCKPERVYEVDMNFRYLPTSSTAIVLRDAGVECEQRVVFNITPNNVPTVPAQPTVTPTRTPTPRPTNTPTPRVNPQAIGVHDSLSCTRITGWACDLSNASQPIDIHVYQDGAAGQGGTAIVTASANITREAGVGTACGGNRAHGFDIALPASSKDGRTHSFYVYAIGINNNGVRDSINPLLASTPKTLNTTTCLPTATPRPPTATPTRTPTPRPTNTIAPTKAPTIAPTKVPTTAPVSGQKITVYAQGSLAGNVGPTMVVKVNGTTVNTFSNIGTTLKGYSLTVPATIGNKINNVSIHFDNDQWWDGDRNLRVDRVVVDGKEYPTEATNVYAEGALVNARCVNGNTRSEWLNCNGLFRYTIATPTAVPTRIINNNICASTNCELIQSNLNKGCTTQDYLRCVRGNSKILPITPRSTF